MKFYVLTAALLLSLFATSNSFAGEPSRDMLGKMGLSGMKTMSDSQGMQVRGMGSFTYVAGTSVANGFNGSTTTNVYNAGSTVGYGATTAVGGSLSLAGGAASFNGHTSFFVVGAAGGSFAFAGPVHH